MDPMSTLSVEAAAVQFVDFGSRILSDTCEIFPSSTGQASHHVELSELSRDLGALAKGVENQIGGIAPRPGSGLEMLKKHCGECSKANTDVDKLLAKLTASKVSSFDSTRTSI